MTATAGNAPAGSPAKKAKHDGSPDPSGSNFDLAAPTFDLDVWAAHYEGATVDLTSPSPRLPHLTPRPGPLLPLRLAHAACHCPPLARQAMQLAIAAAKQGKDVQLYVRLCELAGQLSFRDLATPDPAFVSKQAEGNRRELARLEGELRGYKNNLIRESIRMGQEDLANHHLATGGPPPDPAHPQGLATAGLNAAFQAYNKMRDYCTTPTHMSAMILHLLYTALLQAVAATQVGSPANQHYTAMLSNCSRLRTCGVKEEEQAKLAPIAAAMSGLAQLGTGSYRDAARSFLATPIAYATLGSVHGLDFGRLVATANDIAVYGGLTALATLSRGELVATVLGGPFRAFLELEPHMRKAISLYTTAKYQACLQLLHRYYSDWSLDIFLGAPAGGAGGDSHVDVLFSRVRARSITAYFSSFAQVSLASLAETFPPTSQPSLSMEEEILHMIQSSQLDARLDVVDGMVIAPPAKKGREVENAREVAEEVERGLLSRLWRVNVALAGCEVPRSNKGVGVWGGAGQTVGGW